jgi:hypothetical protein
LQHHILIIHGFLYLKGNERITPMRFIFSKAGFTLLLVLLAMLWLGGGIMKQLIQAPSSAKQNIETSLSQPQNNSQDTTPAIVHWIVETSQPIASELRVTLNFWWEGQKVALANQIIKWMTQQQQYITSGIQTQLREMIKKALGVNSATSQ